MARLPQAGIPVVDVSTSNASAAREVLDAAVNYGFVFVKNEGEAAIEHNQIEKAFQADCIKARLTEQSKDFFKSPTQEKDTCRINTAESGKNRGWIGSGDESLDPERQKHGGDRKEAFNFGEPTVGPKAAFQQPLPPALQTHSQELVSFYASCHRLCTHILRLFAEALDIDDRDWFSKAHDRESGKPSGSVLRLLYYPASPSNGANEQETNGNQEEQTDVRAGAHSDYGSITLLFQRPGQPGLEILTKDNQWESVPVDPQDSMGRGAANSLPILVNIGDLLSYWTDGLLRSTVHRVVVPPEARRMGDRFSIAFFCHPLDEARLVPVPSAVVREHSRKTSSSTGGAGGQQKVLTAKDHLNERLDATYGKKIGGSV